MTLRHFTSTIILILSIGTSGCAFGNRSAILTYPQPSISIEKRNSSEVCLEQLRDGREKIEIGEVRNIYYMRTAQVHTVTDVPGWATDAVAKEMEATGFSVRRVPAGVPHQDCSVTISGSLTKAFVHMWFSFNGEVMLNLSVTRNGQNLLTSSYTGLASGGDFTASGSGYAENLSRALSAAVQQFVGQASITLGS